MKISEVIASINDESHYLRKESEKLSAYRGSFSLNIKNFYESLSNREKDILLKNKLFFNRTFDQRSEKSFIQSACELTVVSFFANHYPETFVYEPTVNLVNDKNVECQISTNNFTYNIEVKCPTFERLEDQNLESKFRFTVPVRTNMVIVNDMINILNRAIDDQVSYRYEVPRRMDNTLKDFFKSAGEKFVKTSNEKIANILIICCSDESSMQDFSNYLFLEGGFFNKNVNQDILPVGDYDNVDAVVLCNLYHRHNKYFNKSHIINHWNFAESFNLIFDNLNRKYKDEKIDAISYFIQKVLYNYTFDFFRHLQADDEWPANTPLILREVMCVRNYTALLKSKGLNYF